MRSIKQDSDLTLERFAERLEDCGLLAFGEPRVNYTIKQNQEFLNVYLDFSKHGVHATLTTAILTPDATAKRKFLYSDEDIENVGTDDALTECVKKFSNRTISDSGIDYDALSQAALIVGNHSQTKKLTFFLACQILEQDSLKLPNQSQGNQEAIRSLVGYFINSSPETISKPEEVAYLSRLDLNLAEKSESLKLPLQWLAKSYVPDDPFTSITLPKRSIDVFADRTRVRVS